MTQEAKIQWPGWELGKVLGRGGFSTVYEIRRETFGEVETAALKVISIPQDAADIEELKNDGYDEASITARFRSHMEQIVREYNLMAKLKGHPNIVYCDDLRYIQRADSIGWDIYIKMELLTPLVKALPAQIPEAQVIKVGMDICNALILCREYDVIHRDIKPQNIFMGRDGSFKLGDFGIAKTTEKTSSGTKVGTYKYMAPEVYKAQPYGSRADIYSLGLVLYWMLNKRRTPFLPLPPQAPGISMEEDARMRRFSGEALPPPAEGSMALKQIVLKACAYDPGDRYDTAEQMLRDLKSLSLEPPIATPVRKPEMEEDAPTEHTEGIFYGWEERERRRRQEEEARRREEEEARLQRAREEKRRRQQAQERQRREKARQEELLRREQEALAQKKKQKQKRSSQAAVILALVAGIGSFVVSRIQEKNRQEFLERNAQLISSQQITAQYPQADTSGNGEHILSYREFLDAPMNTDVILETNVQASLDPEDGKTCIYCQDEAGAYYLYNVGCSEKEAAALAPGTRIRVEGVKSEWAGSISVDNASVTVIPGESYTAQPKDITDLLESPDLAERQNQLVSLQGISVTSIYYDASKEERDISIGLKYQGNLYDALVLYRLVGLDSDLYRQAIRLKPGDQVDLVGYLNWYSGPLIHVVSMTKTN